MDETGSPLPPINVTNTDAPLSSQNPEVNSAQSKRFILLIIGILVVVIIAATGYYFYTSKKSAGATNTIPSEKISGSPVQESTNTTATTSKIQSIFTQVSKTYNGNLPWENLNNKQTYEFFSKSIGDLPVANDEISENYDSNYSAITSMDIEGNAVPIKSSYIGYYEIPEVQAEKYNLSTSDIVFPVLIKIYEFDRPLNANELAVVETNKFFNCTNDKATVKQTIQSDENIISSYCNLNLTTSQKESLSKGDYKDVYYIIYFKKRNIVLQMSLDSRLLKDTDLYVSDYISKLFNSNKNLIIDPNQIQTIQEARKFEEWRHRTFDK